MWMLGVALMLGLKHAMEADHLAAVSTIVSESRGMLRSFLVGGLWGIGHTLSLLAAGVTVIVLHLQIGPRLAVVFEFGVAVMLIALGANLLRKLLGGGTVHVHAHTHGGRVHVHVHVHEAASAALPHTHHGLRLELRPLLVGMVHGLAGSAALMLLVLSTITSPILGVAYIAAFGLGSIGGMAAMSALVALPAHLASGRFRRLEIAVQGLAGSFSLGLGLFMAYEIGRGGVWL